MHACILKHCTLPQLTPFHPRFCPACNPTAPLFSHLHQVQQGIEGVGLQVDEALLQAAQLVLLGLHGDQRALLNVLGLDDSVLQGACMQERGGRREGGRSVGEGE
jgi:hypothetical protein